MQERNKLLSIQIKNLGVIESANLNFSDGLTVLTGETGAGKTMVLTALSLILGGKAEQRLVRAGADRLLVGAEFEVNKELAQEVEELGGAIEDGVLLITRIVTNDGKSKAMIGGTPVPAGVLASIGESLIEIHAQSSSLRLSKEGVQRDLLDRFANNLELREKYRTQLIKFKEAESKVADLESSLKNREREIARLQELAALVKKFEISPNIYEEIDNEISRLEAVEDLNRCVAEALEVLNSEESSVGMSLRAAAKSLNMGRSLDKDLNLLATEFSQGVQSIESVISDLGSYKSKLNADPQRFDYLQSRKAELNGLFKKYGSGDDKNLAINDLFDQSKSAAEQISDLSGGDDRLAELKKFADLELKNTIASASALTENRVTVAEKISSTISAELAELSLAGAIFEIEVKSAREITSKDLTASGVDSISFNFASHKSAKLAPLGKSASGGELSRVMLALEVVLSKSSDMGTYIFDEVDSGVGGKAAIEVGKKLAKVALNSQVIVVTHLPQVAAWATNHFVVEKSDKGDFVESSVLVVEGEERKTEIARLLSGQANSESAREHAGELLDLVVNSALR